MNLDEQRRNAAARSLCAELDDDDGVPMRRELGSKRSARTDASGLAPTDESAQAEPTDSHPATGRKTRQLCAQVQRALHEAVALPGFLSEPGLVVAAVEPAPDASRLRVVISAPAEAAASLPALAARVTAAAGGLRAVAARRIHRKRAPQLFFDITLRKGLT